MMGKFHLREINKCAYFPVTGIFVDVLTRFLIICC